MAKHGHLNDSSNVDEKNAKGNDVLVGDRYALVAAKRERITRFERVIQVTLARIWGKATPSGSPK